METTNLKLSLTSSSEASVTTFKEWRESINGATDSNFQKIDDFAGKVLSMLIDGNDTAY